MTEVRIKNVEKACRRCGTTFLVSEFNTAKVYCCKRCQCLYWRVHYENNYKKQYYRQRPKNMLLRSAKERAKKRGLPFDITTDDFELPTHCPLLGIPLVSNLGSGAGGKFNSYSLDKIDHAKGYVKGNVMVMSHLANSMKSNATKEQLIAFANWILTNQDIL